MGVGYDSGRNSGYSDTLRDIAHNNCAGTYVGVVAYVDIFNNAHIGTYIHIVAYNCWGIVVRSDIKKLTEVYVVADYCVLVYNHTYPVSEIQAVAYLANARNLHGVFDR